MFRLNIILGLFAILLTFNSTAQEKPSIVEKKGKPIVEVFSSFYFNPFVENKIGFRITRAHLGYQYRFDEHFMAKIILDRGSPTTIGSVYFVDTLGNQNNANILVTNGSNLTMTLKFAFLEWKLNDHFKLQAGSILQNHYITQERYWSYRYVLPTFIDRYYRIPSADLGVITFYKFNKSVGVDFAVTNGEGFRIEQDLFGNVKVAAGVDLNIINNFHFRLFYHINSSTDLVYNSNEQLFAFFACYEKKDVFKIDFEFNYISSYLNINNFNSGGISVYGNKSLSKKWDLFARYDLLKYDKPVGVEMIESYNNGHAIIAGVQYEPIQNIELSLSYQGWFGTAVTSSNLFVINLRFKI
jgi:opacity protein-like surface antigen